MTQNAQLHLFTPESWIVHRTMGIGQIEEIEKKTISGEDNRYYRIRLDDTIMWVPIEAEDIRPITPPDKFEDAVERLQREATPLPSHTTARMDRIRKVRKSHSPHDLARMIRDLFVRMNLDKKISYNERKALTYMRTQFVKEWARSKRIPIAEAQQKLTRLLNQHPQLN